MSKLPARAAVWLLPLVLTFLMTFIVAGISTFRAIGAAPNLVSMWMISWMWSWAVAFPTMFLVMPLARRIVGAITLPPPGAK